MEEIILLAFLINAIKIVFLLGLLIFIHEGGHFLVAKLSRVKVNEFALGFGPTIWKKQGKETKYALRAIPLGGFVSMEGEDSISDDERAFGKASMPKRIAIVAAGATVNIVFGLIVYFFLTSYVGPVTTNEVESLIQDYGAEIAGIKENDKIIKINNKKIKNKEDINEILSLSDGKEVKIVIERKGKKIEYNVKPTEVKYKEVGIYLKDSNSTEIVAIEPESPAQLQGLEVNDIILYVEGQDVRNNSQKIINLINEDEDGKIEFIIKRKELEKQITVNAVEKNIYFLGVNLKKSPRTFFSRIDYGFNKTQNFAFSIVKNLKQLFTGKVSTDQLMGPVGISSVVSNTEGIKDYIYILALISLSLGVTNLLPFPPLDGGKIVLLIIEAIRRKSLPKNVENYIQMAGFIVLITLSIYITYNDTLRIF